MIAKATFESNQIKEKFNIYHKVSYKNNYNIYLLEYLLCKIQYVGKFHTRLYNHRKDTKNYNAIEACKHFNN